jgi:hypothetical protein
VIDEFTASRSLEPFGCGTVGLDFRHIVLLFQKEIFLASIIGGLTSNNHRISSTCGARQPLMPQ